MADWFCTFREEEMALLLLKDIERIQLDRWQLLFEKYRLFFFFLTEVNYCGRRSLALDEPCLLGYKMIAIPFWGKFGHIPWICAEEKANEEGSPSSRFKLEVFWMSTIIEIDFGIIWRIIANYANLEGCYHSRDNIPLNLHNSSDHIQSALIIAKNLPSTPSFGWTGDVASGSMSEFKSLIRAKT